jgi:ABC-type Fe3+-hydroxamate transport system substrate-binding protein
MILAAPYLSSHPKKIISIVPSITELLSKLGLEEEVIGITKFCVHPDHWFRNKIKVGGTKTLNIPLIKKLCPGLIIANKEENEKSQIELLQADVNIWVTDISTLQGAISMIKDVGGLTGKFDEATALIAAINNEFSGLPVRDKKISAAYLIWQNPYMAAGGDTFINDMMNQCGLQNIFSDKKRYPEITLEELKTVAADAQNKPCELLLLSSEPYPFSQKHVMEIQKYLPWTKIILADGEMFSWYGSRLLLAPCYFKKFLSSM